MKSKTSFALILSLLLCPFLQTSPEASLCRKALSFFKSLQPEDREYTEIDWRREWEQTVQAKDTEAAAYVLVQLILVKSESLKLNLIHRSGLKFFSQTFSKMSVRQFFYKKLKRLGTHYLWSLGPTLFRILSNYEERFKFKKAQEYILTEWNKDSDSRASFFEILGINNTQFANEVFDYIFTSSESKKRIAKYQIGSIAAPILIKMYTIAFALSTHVILNPISTKFLPISEQKYSESKFIDNAEKYANKPLSESDVILIVDSDMLKDALASDGSGNLLKIINPDEVMLDPTALPMIQNIKNRAKTFNAILVHSVDEFNSAMNSATNADFVFVNFHGLPGLMGIGGRAVGIDYNSGNQNLNMINSRSLKPGAILVFLSCLFGEKQNINEPDNAETWIQFSKKFVSSGKAIASVDTIGFNTINLYSPSKNTNETKRRIFFISFELLSVAKTVLIDSAMSPLNYEIQINNWLTRRKPVLSGDKPSLRVFDAESGEVKQYFLGE